MQATNRIRNILAALCIVLVAAALIGPTVWTSAREAPVVSPVAKPEMLAPMVATFTGEFANGVPVYRLPAITATASRNVELVEMAREAQFAAK